MLSIYICNNDGVTTNLCDATVLKKSISITSTVWSSRDPCIVADVVASACIPTQTQRMYFAPSSLNLVLLDLIIPNSPIFGNRNPHAMMR